MGYYIAITYWHRSNNYLLLLCDLMRSDPYKECVTQSKCNTTRSPVSYRLRRERHEIGTNLSFKYRSGRIRNLKRCYFIFKPLGVFGGRLNSSL